MGLSSLSEASGSNTLFANCNRFTIGEAKVNHMQQGVPRQQRERTRTKLDPRALGLAGGISLASWVVVIGLLSRIGWGDRWRRLFADLYPGYGSSLRGLVIGVAWAFFDGATVGAAFAWLYNALAR